MLLKSLEMQGFKSFPDRTRLEFGKGITAVVGPNGSGKSNISDAVRWVLGEQSTKSLRGSKMEDVVFGGTGARRALGFAEVTLTLDNTDRTLPCDHDEIAITRRYYRSGESEYMLNRAAVRLRDIHELFMDTGLGRDGYSIVGQGKIADIISSKSEERREIFEEAAGISRYRYRRNDAQRRLSQAQENLIRLKDIVTELEGRVGPLKEQSEKAQKYVVLAQEQKELQIGLWLNALEKSKTELREQDKKLSYARAQYEETEQLLARIETDSENIRMQTQDKSIQIDALRRRAAGIEEEILRIQGQIQVLENTIVHNKDTIARITRDMEQAEDTQQHIQEQIAEKEKAVTQLSAGMKQRQEALEKTEQELSAVRKQGEETALELERLSAERADILQKISDLRVQESTSASSMEEIRARIGSIETTVQVRQKEVDIAQKRRQESGENLTFCIERVKEQENNLSRAENEAERCTHLLEEQKSANERLNLQIQQKLQRARMLSDMEKNLEGYAGSVKAVMQEARRGRLKGILGPVSQLISVPERFTVAVETALGGSLQHIITENDGCAKEAIGYLKNQHAGRATFLPLNSVKGMELNEPSLTACKGFIEIASRAVSYDNNYAGVIKSLLGRTVIVETIDDALSIARQFGYKFRIVTLDGQVLNAGGSMTGGSQTRNAGMLSRANEITKMQKQGEELKKQLEIGNDNYRKYQLQLAQAKQNSEKARRALTHAQEDLIREQGEYKLLSGQLESAQKALDALMQEKASADTRLQSFAGVREQAGAALEGLANTQAEIETKLAELSSLRTRCDTQAARLGEENAGLKLALMSIQKDLDALRESLESLFRRKNSHSGKVGQILEEIQGIENNNLTLDGQISALKRQAGDARAQNSRNRTQEEQLLKEREMLEQQVGKLHVQERTKTAEREKLGGELARLEEKKSVRQKEYDEIINKLYDDYQLTRNDAEALGIVIENPAEAQKRLNSIKSRIKQIGMVNLAAIEEYKEVSERYEFMSGQIADVEKARDELKRMINELTAQMRRQFQEQFVKINEHFGETFAELFGGGKAQLNFEDPSDILESGIEIRVQPPGKNVQNIDLFSGGEKALVAIALLFAILKVTPAPFCIFDEVEAALDDVNVERFAQYMRQMTSKTQFIAITHRRGTMEEADVLYGVTMQEEGVSKLLELKTAEMAQKLGL